MARWEDSREKIQFGKLGYSHGGQMQQRPRNQGSRKNEQHVVRKKSVEDGHWRKGMVEGGYKENIHKKKRSNYLDHPGQVKGLPYGVFIKIMLA